MSNDKKTICVCDDDPHVIDSMTVLLNSAGYAVLSAHDHTELTALLQEAKPDLLLLDVRMPGRDGFWIAECLQVLGNSCPIFLMTAYDRFIYRLYAPFVGTSEYLTKPIDPQSLLEKIKHTLSQSGKRTIARA